MKTAVTVEQKEKVVIEPKTGSMLNQDCTSLVRPQTNVVSWDYWDTVVVDVCATSATQFWMITANK